MGCLRFKDGVRLDPMTVGGACLLAALARVAIRLPYDLMVTSGTDGAHSGPDDPHHQGSAFDVRTHGLPLKDAQSLLTLILSYLAEFTSAAGGNAAILETSGGLATELFFAFLEDVGTANEHLHCQLRKGHTFAPKVVSV